MRALAIGGALALCGCTSVQLPADPVRTFDPIAFFAGRTQGEGRLSVVLSQPKRVRVESFGTASRDGHSLRLRQAIDEEGKDRRWREWRLQRLGAGRYTGTLTDAVGPVSIASRGPRAVIRYTMPGGLRVEQQLALQPGGRTLLNHMTIGRFGVRAARLEETITKVD